MIVIGTPIDVKLSLTVFAVLKKMIERNARQLYGYKWSKIHRSYAEGFTFRLLERAEEEVNFEEEEESGFQFNPKRFAEETEEEAKEEKKSYALVLRNKENQVEDYYEKLSEEKNFEKGRSKKSRVNVDAFTQGNEDAEEVDLNFKDALVEEIK